MPLFILSRTDTNQVGSLAVNTVKELQKRDRSTDLYFTGVFGKLVKESTILNDAVGIIRKKDFTEQLIEKDDLFDRVFQCAKQFVHASTMVLDDALAHKAEKIWLLFDAHNINLDRLGYEQQIFLTNSLLKELAKPVNRAIVDELLGVSAQIDLLELHNRNLSDLFQQSKEAEAAKANLIAPSAQKNVVRDIMNKELLPYLEVMSKANPDMFAESFDLISEFVTSINSKVRARVTRNENQNQEEILEENN
jgi:hypothetical protein